MTAPNIYFKRPMRLKPRDSAADKTSVARLLKSSQQKPAKRRLFLSGVREKWPEPKRSGQTPFDRRARETLICSWESSERRIARLSSVVARAFNPIPCIFFARPHLGIA
jgi:hypothetical protein